MMTETNTEQDVDNPQASVDSPNPPSQLTLEMLAEKLGLTLEQLITKLVQDMLTSPDDEFNNFAALNNDQTRVIQVMIDRWLEARGEARVPKAQLAALASPAVKPAPTGLSSSLMNFFIKVHSETPAQDLTLQNTRARVLNFENVLEYNIKITHRFWPGTYQREVAFVTILKSFYVDVLQALHDLSDENERTILAKALLTRIRQMSIRHFHYRQAVRGEQTWGDINKIDLANWFGALVEKITLKDNVANLCEWYEQLMSQEISTIDITNGINDLPAALEIFTNELSKRTGKRF